PTTRSTRSIDRRMSGDGCVASIRRNERRSPAGRLPTGHRRAIPRRADAAPTHRLPPPPPIVGLRSAPTLPPVVHPPPPDVCEPPPPRPAWSPPRSCRSRCHTLVGRETGTASADNAP